MRKVSSILAVAAFAVFGSFANAAESKSVNITVTEKGFEPSSIDVKAGSEVTLNVTRKTDATCATQIQVGSNKEKIDLPLNKSVPIELGKLKKGEVRFACGMEMLSGVIVAK